MSLLPLLLSDSWSCPIVARPSRILDQHFGHGLESEDIFQPLNLNNHLITRTPAGYLRNWRSNALAEDYGTTVSYNNNKFQANLDVQQFKPEEISVKLTGDNVLTIEGKHEEMEDQHGFIFRHFIRKYVVPNKYDTEKIQTKLSSDGVLTITAPVIEEMEVGNRSIPIIQTGEPARQQDAEYKN